MQEPTTNEKNEKNVTEVLSSECSGEIGKEVNEIAVKVDVINNIQYDGSNKISFPAIAATPFQVSVTFEMIGDAKPADVKNEANSGAAINEEEKSVTMETSALTNYDIIADTATCEGDVIAKNDNEFHTLSDQDASTISSVSEIEQVQKNEEITSELKLQPS